MKLLVIIFLTISTTSSRNVPEPIKFSSQDARTYRGAVSYSTSVLHQDPNHPDQHAESTITVDFQPNTKDASRKRPKIITDQATSPQTYIQQRPESAQVFNSPETQAFNVGYSVRFNGSPHQSPSQSRQPHRNAEIITGSRKEVVQKPNSDFTAQDYVDNALIDIKKQKISGIKPKYNKQYSNSNSKDNDGKSFISNLAPKTQQYLSYLGEPKSTPSPKIRYRQKIQSTTESYTPSWTSLSPTVEIYHSKDLTLLQESGKNFDHTGAIGNSQGFDYTNVLDGIETINEPYHSYQFKEHRAVPILENPNVAPSYKTVQVLPITAVQVLQKPVTTETTKKPIPPKLPIDMSLLRNPVLSLNGKNTQSDSDSLSIPFDTTLLQAMHQKLATAVTQNNVPNMNQVNLLQGHTGILGGPLGNLALSAQPSIKTNLPMKINRNPQAIFLRNENFDQYFNRYLDNVQPQETRIDNFAVPLPIHTYSSRLNAAKDIEMDLRPPPFKVNRRRRMFMY